MCFIHSIDHVQRYRANQLQDKYGCLHTIGSRIEGYIVSLFWQWGKVLLLGRYSRDGKKVTQLLVE